LTDTTLLIDRASYDAAQELLSLFGGLAAYEAKARANQSRDIGNVVHYCRWRSVERFICALSEDTDGETRH